MNEQTGTYATPGTAGQLLQLAHENRSSIEVTKNAKGERTFAVKLYWDQDQEGAEQKALERIAFIDAELLRKYGP